MIKISKKEAAIMRQLGYSEFVKHSYSKNKHYYLVEETEDVYKWYKKGKKYVKGDLVRLSAMNALEQYRKSHIIKEVKAIEA